MKLTKGKIKRMLLKERDTRKKYINNNKKISKYNNYNFTSKNKKNGHINLRTRTLKNTDNYN